MNSFCVTLTIAALLSFFTAVRSFALGSANAHFSPRMLKPKSLSPLDATGRVKFFDVTKGFGFITPDDGSGDVFVHQTQIYAEGFRSLGEGEEVEFEMQEDAERNRKFAVKVTGPGGGYVQGAPRPPRREF